MKNVLICFCLLFAAASTSHAQSIKTPPASKQAAVAEWIGLTKVAIHYHRPGVKGREGQIYSDNGVVPYVSNIPWRAGADENTTIYFEHEVTINGQALPAGKYGFHIIPTATEWTLIFSKNSHAWGSYFYDPADDALRVTVKPQACDFVEWLSYDFINQTDNSADIRLRWERQQITFTVAADVVGITIAGMEKTLEGLDGFDPQSYTTAAQYCVSVDREMDKALVWAQRALDPNFGGQKNFNTLSTYALVLDKMGKKTEAQAAIDEALPLGSMSELHFYARQLTQNGDPQGAMKVFKLNRERHPEDQFTTIVGLARGNMAIGEYKEAAKLFRQAAVTAPQGQANFYEDLARQCDEAMNK
ncbi:MAG TPA: DUF2911 domain-containing protein [Saprospiraceae bacterium]|nr:DUF2911 domain-containing protein [Saprospiraceae bacterium]HMQ84359.1 DUF2911 domain-containing protein [Saprospiraceae bacterium]